MLATMIMPEAWHKPRARAKRVMGSMFSAVLLSLVFANSHLQAHASEVPFYDFPFLVHCEVSGADHAFYLSRIGADGVAIYITPAGLAGTVTIDGRAKPVGANGPGNCSGKTLDQLRSAGQTYYLQR